MTEHSNRPLVSVITPCHNAEPYVKECIRSVQAQTFGDYEHLLVDDCSSDKTAMLIRQEMEQDVRIKLLSLIKNEGAGVARNKAIECAKGRYIAFLDCDDLWKPEKLERQLALMRQFNYAFTFTAYEKMDRHGNLLPNNVVTPPDKVTYHRALLKNPIGCLTAMYDSEFYGKRYMPEIRKRQDYALWLNLLKESDGFGLHEVLASYRTGNESISSNKLSLIKYEWKIYREVENLSLGKSVFYLISALILKLKSYF